MLSSIDYNFGVTDRREMANTNRVGFLDVLISFISRVAKKIRKAPKTSINRKLLRVDVVEYVSMVLVKQGNENGVVYSLVAEEELIFEKEGTFLKYWGQEAWVKGGNVYQLEGL